MYRTLYNDRIIHYPNEETIKNRVVDMNISGCYRDPDYFRHLNTSYNDNPVDSMDEFSHALLSQSQANTSYDFTHYDTFYVNDPVRRTMSCDAIGGMDKNASSISFFMDLKDHFNRNLLDKLRNYVLDIYANDLLHFKLSGADLITVTHDEFRDRAAFLKRKMSSAEISIVQIYLALREKYKVIETTSVPSVGSLLHTYGTCKPCVFANKKSNYCKSGFGCNFCHYNHKVSKSKGASKASFSRMSSHGDFFNKLIRTPKNDIATLRSMTTDDGFSVSSSSASILSMNDLRGSVRDDMCHHIPGRPEHFYYDPRDNGLLRL